MFTRLLAFAALGTMSCQGSQPQVVMTMSQHLAADDHSTDFGPCGMNQRDAELTFDLRLKTDQIDGALELAVACHLDHVRSFEAAVSYYRRLMRQQRFEQAAKIAQAHLDQRRTVRAARLALANYTNTSETLWPLGNRKEAIYADWDCLRVIRAFDLGAGQGAVAARRLYDRLQSTGETAQARWLVEQYQLVPSAND